jgi:hypothetical protein
LTIVDPGVSYLSLSRAAPTYPIADWAGPAGLPLARPTSEERSNEIAASGEVLKLAEIDSGTYALSGLLEQRLGESCSTRRPATL